MDSSNMVIAVVLLLSVITDITFGQDFVIRPQEFVVTKSGEEVTLNCKVNPSDSFLVWSEYMTNLGSSTPIYDSINGVNDAHMATYDVVKPTSGDHNLRISMPSENEGGQHECKIGQGIKEKQSASHLMIVDQNSPQILGLSSLEEGKERDVRCEARYAANNPSLGDANRPYLGMRTPSVTYNKDSATETITINNAGEYSKISLNFTYIPQKSHHGSEIICEFKVDAPSFMTQAAEIIQIKHELDTVTLIPHKAVYQVGENITCTSNGYPDPTIHIWSKAGQEAEPNNEVLQITNDMVSDGEQEWTCLVKQPYSSTGGDETEAMESIVFTVEYGPGGEPGGSTGDGGSNTTAIALGVCIPLILIIIIVIVVYILYKRRQKNQGGSGSKPPLESGPMGAYPGDVNPVPDPTQPHTPTGTGAPYTYTGPGAVPPAGRDSPGYGDLGIKHINGGYPANPNISHSFDESFDADRVGRETPTKQNAPPPTGRDGYTNVTYNPSPKGSMEFSAPKVDSGTAV